MSDSIIVGVTDAEGSQRAVDWAAARARRGGESLVLFSVVGGATGAVGEDDVLAAAVTATRARLEQQAELLRSTGVSCEVRVSHGNPVAELVEASKDARLLVIGGEKRGQGRRGQHGYRIAAGSHSPVVVVPLDAPTDGEGVVVGVDGSEVSDAAVAFAAAEAERFGENLTIVSAWMPVAVPGDFGVYPDLYLTDLHAITQSAVDRVAEKVNETYPVLEVQTRVVEGDPAAAIADAAGSARLVVVGSHGRGAFARFLLGSVSEEVVSQVTTATAVVR